jgi:methylated-DNA-protein-cysteine methyltransferase-like protein
MRRRSPLHARILAVVRRIPRGRVATYGQVARLAGIGPHPRLVGYALAALAEASDVPWHRVVNAHGRVSPRATPGADSLQRALLEREGVAFDARGRIDLARRSWRPADRGSRTRDMVARRGSARAKEEGWRSRASRKAPSPMPR